MTLISQEHRKGFRVHRGFSGVFLFCSESAQVDLQPPDCTYVHTFSLPICFSEYVCRFHFVFVYKPARPSLLTSYTEPLLPWPRRVQTGVAAVRLGPWLPSRSPACLLLGRAGPGGGEKSSV